MNIDENNYYDSYFEKGHIWLKIIQTIVMIFSWIVFFLPCIITTLTYIAHQTHGRYGYYFWHYSEGYDMINLLLVILLFAVAMIAVFCISFGYVQAQRARGLVTKWPMYNVKENMEKRQRIEDYMEARFGNIEYRHSVRNYTVKPEQNIAKDVFKNVIEAKEK
ncbi:hypothetical protein [Lactobacillus kalixensis]|uniref:Uncharacterized protein n=1 Tax=Lactobacillus kalixensis DSM 16043 TaxID=1423763 RepID=A0A0R1UFT8_9LACO|nr:hypothetical protein [Lactobacillus kalixensis]KRL90154.1 hypothetical protein FC46_GL000340 [Lactobacillus kalixensis DSM 16043]